MKATGSGRRPDLVSGAKASRSGAAGGRGNRSSSPHRADGRPGGLLAASTLLAIALAACTGTATPQLAATVNGVVADSAALTGVVSLKDASPDTKEVAARTDASGSFAVNVSGLTPPFLLKTDATSAAGTTSLYALSSGGAVNINPITDAVVAGAGGGIDPGVLYAQPDPEVLRSAQGRAGNISAQLTTALAPLLQKYGVTDPVGDTSPAGAAALRALLADVKIEVSGGNVVVTNQQTAAVIYDGPSTDPAAGTFQASSLPADPTPPVPACTYTYSAWGTCQADGTQTRTVTAADPSGCAGTPVLTQSCTPAPTPPSACTYAYSAWGTCQADGTQTRTVTAADPSGCAGTPVLTQACTPPVPLPPGGVPSALVAFPGAEGGGALTQGGRGGKVIKVTNLSDTGTGSLRACMEASAPEVSGCSGSSCARTCVFTTGGTITLHSTINVRKGYLTVAGQTAPGGGVQLRGDGTKIGTSLIALSTGVNDVIIRFIRVRPGYSGAPSPNDPAGFSFWTSKNVIVDHVSTAWDGNKAFSSGYGSNAVTVSWSLFAEGLLGHSTGWLSMNTSHAQADAMVNNDGHHNMLVTFDHRLPYYEGKNFRWVNNYVFNYNYAAMSSAGIDLDVIGNVWDWRGHFAPATDRHEWRWQRLSSGDTGTDTNMGPSTYIPSFYMVNNIGPDNRDGTLDDFSSMLRQQADGAENGVDIGSVDPSYKRTTPLPAYAIPITTTTLAVPGDGRDLLAVLKDTAGASQQVTCAGQWQAARDEVDACLVDYVVNPSHSPSGPPSSQTASVCSAGSDGYPVLSSGAPCADSDGNNLPDAWEIRVCGSAGCAGSANGTNICGSGWTNLECYMNGMK